jgi:hypothetical protein
VEFAFVGGVHLSDFRIGTFNKNFKNRGGSSAGGPASDIPVKLPF